MIILGQVKPTYSTVVYSPTANTVEALHQCQIK